VNRADILTCLSLAGVHIQEPEIQKATDKQLSDLLDGLKKLGVRA
jgi:hypothetical protein